VTSFTLNINILFFFASFFYFYVLPVLDPHSFSVLDPYQLAHKKLYPDPHVDADPKHCMGIPKFTWDMWAHIW
jgi:hypothetical protein